MPDGKSNRKSDPMETKCVISILCSILPLGSRINHKIICNIQIPQFSTSSSSNIAFRHEKPCYNPPWLFMTFDSNFSDYSLLRLTFSAQSCKTQNNRRKVMIHTLTHNTTNLKCSICLRGTHQLKQYQATSSPRSPKIWLHLCNWSSHFLNLFTGFATITHS
jgi:hypothetical protein